MVSLYSLIYLVHSNGIVVSIYLRIPTTVDNPYSDKYTILYFLPSSNVILTSSSSRTEYNVISRLNLNLLSTLIILR